MHKSVTIFMIVAFITVAFVMYLYWQQESKIVTKGVLVSNEIKVEWIV